mgnify:CR=1 FL=1
MKEHLVLASESPRRKELLESVGCRFDVIPSDTDESKVRWDRENPANYAMELALLKAEHVAGLHPDRFVIAADTIVVLDRMIYGKPKNRGHAREMLKSLSGKCHKVITGVCIMKKDENIQLVDHRCTDVWFDRLSDKKIESYLDTEEYKDKAGAYGIQDKGALLVKRIEGCFFNVMGLPVNLLEEMFNKLGRSFLDDAK